MSDQSAELLNRDDAACRICEPVHAADENRAPRTDDGCSALRGAEPPASSSPLMRPPIRETELGRGRSGVVYRARDAGGRVFARKVFGASGLTKLVQRVLLGAPNPYVWCEPAVRCAMLRRQVLAELVPIWFKGRVRVANALGYAWNDAHKSFELRCEFVKGRHAALSHPYATRGDDELGDLTRTVMKPLQTRLIEAGFVGQVWQAGRGNPVALNNFMHEGYDADGRPRWVWIDLESGVPALFPLNPLALLGFYLPQSFRLRRPLFDDIDVKRLRRFVDRERGTLEQDLGDERLARLDARIAELERSQRAWKSLARYRASIACRRARGSISDRQAAWYSGRPVRWYVRQAVRAAGSIPARLVAGVIALAAIAARVRIRPILSAAWGVLRSQERRVMVARAYTHTRVTAWRQRGQLSDDQAVRLRGQVDREGADSYIADFGVHLAIKPIVKLLEWWVVPTLWAAGVVDEVFLAAFMLTAGAVVRTVYTLGRLVQNGFAGRERPWVALVVGAIPVIGNLAYPLQIVASGVTTDAAAARFILYDFLSRLGCAFPIWGGPDTLTEHVLNRLPDALTCRARDDTDLCRAQDSLS